MTNNLDSIDYYGNDGVYVESSWAPTGYPWELAGRAYYLKAYDVMELLVANGFDGFMCNDIGWDSPWYADSHIIRTGY